MWFVDHDWFQVLGRVFAPSDSFLWLIFCGGSFFPLLGHLTRLLPAKSKTSPPIYVLDTLHSLTERCLTHFSDPFDSEVSRAASGQKYGGKKKRDVCGYFRVNDCICAEMPIR